MLFSNLMNALFGTNTRPDLIEQKQEVAIPVVEEEISSPSEPLPTSRFDSDVEALQKKHGKFETGLSIDETLQDLLVLCPRTRPRSDAYQGLVSYLKSEYGVTLNIKSRKKK